MPTQDQFFNDVSVNLCTPLLSQLSNRQNKKIDGTGIGLKPLFRASYNAQCFIQGTINSYNDEYLSIYYAQDLLDEESKATMLDWLTRFKSINRKELSIEEMAPVIKGVHELIKLEEYKVLNDILETTLTSASSAESIVCLLRASYPSRALLTSWKPLLNNAKAWLSSKKLKPEAVLIGLI